MTTSPEGSPPRPGRLLNTVAAGDGDPRHGKPTTYTNHMCRCSLCREGWANYCRNLRERRARQSAGG